MNAVEKIGFEVRRAAEALAAALRKRGYEVEVLEDRSPLARHLEIRYAGLETGVTIRGGSTLGVSVIYKGDTPIGRDISAAWWEVRK